MPCLRTRLYLEVKSREYMEYGKSTASQKSKWLGKIRSRAREKGPVS